MHLKLRVPRRLGAHSSSGRARARARCRCIGDAFITGTSERIRVAGRLSHGPNHRAISNFFPRRARVRTQCARTQYPISLERSPRRTPSRSLISRNARNAGAQREKLMEFLRDTPLSFPVAVLAAEWLDARASPSRHTDMPLFYAKMETQRGKCRPETSAACRVGPHRAASEAKGRIRNREIRDFTQRRKSVLPFPYLQL